jgi:hypothetical protein
MRGFPIALPQRDRDLLFALALAFRPASARSVASGRVAIETNQIAAVCPGANDHRAAVLILTVGLVTGGRVKTAAQLNRLALNEG